MNMTTTTRNTPTSARQTRATKKPLAVTSASTPSPRKTSVDQAPMLTLTFFTNSNGAPVADLYLGERRLLATTHPATIIAAIFAMGLSELTVTTTEGSHTGTVSFMEADADFWPLQAMKLRMQMNPRLYQFRHLAPAQDYAPILEGLDLFTHENWYDLSELADEHLRAAHHHLPHDLIKRPLVTPAPKGWKKTLARRNGWVYFPFC